MFGTGYDVPLVEAGNALPGRAHNMSCLRLIVHLEGTPYIPPTSSLSRFLVLTSHLRSKTHPDLTGLACSVSFLLTQGLRSILPPWKQFPTPSSSAAHTPTPGPPLSHLPSSIDHLQTSSHPAHGVTKSGSRRWGFLLSSSPDGALAGPMLVRRRSCGIAAVRV